MKLELKRIAAKPAYTIGKLYVDGKYFCDTLEDKVRDLKTEKKVYGATAIPAGTYPIVVNLSAKFRRELPILLGVPQFEGIRIHRGNTPKDTLGCILVGENKKVGQVVNSASYEITLTQDLKAAQRRKETIFLTIQNP